MPGNEQKVRLIGGRRWRTLERSTLRHDGYMTAKIAAAGLDRISRQGDESPEEFAQRLLQKILLSGAWFDLLGGLVLPDELADDQWSEKVAAETAGFLAQVTDAADKQAVREAFRPLLVGFFAAGMGYSARSRTASTAAEAGQPIPAPLHASGSATPTAPISASGQQSSASWGARIRGVLKRCSIGRSGMR
ncbi:MAG TPA: hypothetical protein VNK82_07240 [Terriglobales bacterium]|nr:hypothetical protein [Terriglobales bacterium]